MNRNDLQKLSVTRLREARVLYATGEYSGAYYLAGYAIECALKACFAKGVRRYDFPDKGRADKVFTHDLTLLLKQARLDGALGTDGKMNSRLAASWDEVVRWTEASRYSVWTRNDAEALLDAITNRRDGVMPWIKRRW